MIDRALQKQEAKDVLRGALVSPYLFTLLYLVLDLAMSGLDEYASLPARIAEVLQVEPWLAEELPPSLLQLSFPRLPAMFISILVLMLTITLNAGVALYHLGIRRGEETPYATLFDGFGMAARVVTLGLVQSLLIYLGSLLFIVPGIVLAYRYRFAMYNLLEDPSLSPLAALRMSAAQTRGFKGELFVLDLSFLGWGLLSACTFGLLLIWVIPYYRQTDVGFFQTVKSIQGIGAPPAGGEPFDPFR